MGILTLILMGMGTVNGVRTLSDEDESDVLSGELVSDNGDDFEPFWAAYPRKEARKQSAGLWQHMTADDRARALVACQHYAAWAAEHPDGALMIPPTFLSKAGRRWEDWADGPPAGRDRTPARSAFSVLAAVHKSLVCPECEAGLTYDEIGEHCPVCDWRAP